MAKEGFSKKSLIVLFSIAGVSLITSIFLGVFSIDLETFDSPYANIYSKSAVGHKVFRKLLKDIDIPVSVSNFSTATKASNNGLLLLIEPQLHIKRKSGDSLRTSTSLTEILQYSQNTLLILPKWEVILTYEDKNWVDSVQLYDDSIYSSLFSKIGAYDVKLTSPPRRPTKWDSPFKYDPAIPSLQLLQGADIHPIISCDGGILLGSIDTYSYGTIYLLSDPDLIANYNIVRGNNGLLAVDILDYLREGNEGVIIDEMMHGFVYRKSIWRMLFDFPNITLLLSALLTAGVALWAGLIRLQKPEKKEVKEDWGKAYLVANSAHLITTPRHRLYALDRYFRNTLYTVTKKCAIRCDINNVSLMVEKLSKHTKNNKLKEIHKEITKFDTSTKISSEQMTHLAQKIHRWKKEVTNGTA